jgi:hypothetical protein
MQGRETIFLSQPTLLIWRLVRLSGWPYIAELASSFCIGVEVCYVGASLSHSTMTTTAATECFESGADWL